MKNDMTRTNPPVEAQIQIIIEYYENARMDGLCHEGAWEVAVSQVKDLVVPQTVLDRLEVQLRG